MISSSLSKSFSNLKDSSSFSQRSSTLNLRERDLSLSQENMRNNSRNNNNSTNNTNNNNNNYNAPSTNNLPEIDVIDPHPEIVEEVGKYLVTTDNITETNSNTVNNNSNNNNDDKDKIDNNDEPDEDLSPAGGNFDSLKLQGGDITRGIYNWVNEHTENNRDVSPLKRKIMMMI
ncbi:unnamed protein product [[Candida] boidinii]|uniref:Unnamed protein product n=1 Tax=Candida boidinii TaxID=5477 RepID=A0ACB5U8Q8_CANBO|nr:unnamed protein product [[Candida] boidinii]